MGSVSRLEISDDAGGAEERFVVILLGADDDNFDVAGVAAFEIECLSESEFLPAGADEMVAVADDDADDDAQMERCLGQSLL